MDRVLARVRHNRQQSGLTFIELMIVLIIVGALIAVAAPSYSILVQRTKLKAFANSMVASVYLARSEAIKRNVPVRLCASSDGSSCAGSGGWERGWVVMDPNDVVIRHRQSLTAGMVMYEQASVNTMTFQPSGVASTSAVITLCQQSPPPPVTEEREIRVSSTGRPRIITTTDGCSP